MSQKKKNKINKPINSKYLGISIWDGVMMDLPHFIENIQLHLSDSTVKYYLQILEIDPHKLENILSDEFQSEIKKLVKQFIQYPNIANKFRLYLNTNESKIEFLEQCSPEQIKYITYPEISDTKLIACAGSGKTRSVISRMKFMVEHAMVDKNNIFAITFSRWAAADFHRKIKYLYPNYKEFCHLKNFSTIDSLAKSILCKVRPHKSENVEILSIAFRNYLKTMPNDDIMKIINFKFIKQLFVDEAQDLNEIQYDIIILLKKKFGTFIHLIGDPNQNIYQFRRSSSMYLVNFPGKKFELTLNFRSTQEIIEFAECLKPIATTPSVSATNKRGQKVVVITKPSYVIHELILNFINYYQQLGKDLSNIAIICPTRGVGKHSDVGLANIFNLLRTNNIPVNQIYREAGSHVQVHEKNTNKKDGQVNLITFHGTKGLEFDVVFVLDFYHNLFNRPPSEELHLQNRYLLYVATTRAISQMYICTYDNKFQGVLNNWLTTVDPDRYKSEGKLKISPPIYLVSKSQQVTSITEIIAQLTDVQLDMIHEMFRSEILAARKIYDDFTEIDRGDNEELFGTFCENLFYLQYSLSRRKPVREFHLIKQLLESKYVFVHDEIECNHLKTVISDNNLTWNKYDMMKYNLGNKTCRLIEKYLKRDEEIRRFVICTKNLLSILDTNMEDIRVTYLRYLNPSSYQYDYRQILTDFFYLNVIEYAYQNNHYYYIGEHGKDKQFLIFNADSIRLFEKMNNYVIHNYLTSKLIIHPTVSYPKLFLSGEIDFVEKYINPNNSMGSNLNHEFQYSEISETIVEIKCCKDIRIRHYLQLLLYNFCYYYGKKTSKLFYNKYKIVNLLQGIEYYLLIDITPANMFTLLVELSKAGNMIFHDLNLVYDLETTGLIEDKIYDFYPRLNIPRTIVIRKNQKYHVKIIPEIIEIAIKDYDTGMIIIDTLIKPNKQISKDITMITGITPEMLKDKPTIDEIRSLLKSKMENFGTCNLMAHNGSKFDNIIMEYDNMVDPDHQGIFFIDTINLIIMHSTLKLESKSLAAIYQTLFNIPHQNYKSYDSKSFSANPLEGHRAMKDVDTLIKIMKFLKIEFEQNINTQYLVLEDTPEISNICTYQISIPKNSNVKTKPEISNIYTNQMIMEDTAEISNIFTNKTLTFEDDNVKTQYLVMEDTPQISNKCTNQISLSENNEIIINKKNNNINEWKDLIVAEIKKI